MIHITFPDGAVHTFSNPVTPNEIIQKTQPERLVKKNTGSQL